MPEAVSKWAEDDNWMGGDVVVLTRDTAEVSTGTVICKAGYQRGNISENII